MCGVFGFWQNCQVKDSQIEQMLDGLKSRGPDSQNYSNVSVNTGFGMTRLAINGIEEIQNQPMVNSENSDALVFNGEIYNFKDLRRKLTAAGISFDGNSDTEVVLKSYQVWGVDCFKYFKGMFAIALWDASSEILILARDSLGEKPLYFNQSENGLVFCSSRKLIRRHLDITEQFSDSACLEFHQLGYLSRYKNLDGVYEVAPGCFYVFESHTLLRKVTFDFRPRARGANEFTFTQAVVQLDELLSKTIHEEISSSEVPVGIFMSGGMDSTLIAKKAAEFQPGIELFTAAFSERAFDESEKAGKIAQTLDSKHSIHLVEYSMNLILKSVRALDTPIADTSIVPFFSLSEYAATTHKVCLTGDGGDELFGGYITYQATYLNEKIRRASRLISQLKLVSNFMVSKQGNVDFTYKLRAFLQSCNPDSRLAHQYWRQIYSKSEVEALFSREVSSSGKELNPLWSDLRYLPLIEQAMAFDLKTWLLDDILIKTDRMSMANSLELRSPFLHPDIVRFAQELPTEYKFSPLKRKRIVKEVFKLNFGDNELVKGRKKGFGSPMAQWINENPLDFKELILSSDMYDVYEVEKLFSEHLSKSRDNSYKIFVLLVWSIFHEERRINC